MRQVYPVSGLLVPLVHRQPGTCVDAGGLDPRQHVDEDVVVIFEKVLLPEAGNGHPLCLVSIVAALDLGQFLVCTKVDQKGSGD